MRFTEVIADDFYHEVLKGAISCCVCAPDVPAGEAIEKASKNFAGRCGAWRFLSQRQKTFLVYMNAVELQSY